MNMKKSSQKDKKVKQVLLKIRESSSKEFEWPWLDKKPLSMKNANKFLLASSIDFQMDADKVWRNSSKLTEEIFGDPERLWDYILQTYPTKEKWKSFLNDQKQKGFSIHRFDWVVKKVWDIAKIMKDNYDGDARKIWNNFDSFEKILDNVKNVFGKNSSTISRMVVLALKDSDHIQIKGTDLKPDLHVQKVLSRIYGEEVNEREAIEIARRINPENPGILDNPLYYLGKEICKSTNPKCSVCFLKEVCEKANQTKNF